MSDEEEPAPEPEPRIGPFRKEAVEARDKAIHEVGVLRYSPVWVRAAYWVLLVILMTLLVGASCARVNDYASGPALITASTKAVVSTPSTGIVSEVLVRPGSLVREGQELVRLNNAQELAEVARLEAEFEQQLARSLLDRSDRGAREALVGLRTQLELAQGRLASRTVPAPRDGRIGDIRARPGEYVLAGAPMVTMLEAKPRYRVIALLPGSARPELQVGMPLRLEISGYPYAYQTVSITEVGPQVIGPAEARRLLGPEAGDAVQVTGPVTVVVAELGGDSFEVDGRRLEYHDGMPAAASAPVRQVRLVVLMLPWLRRLF